MSIVNLSAPWIEYYRKLESMFEGDNNVKVVYDAQNMRCDLFVDGEDKAKALTKLLKPSVEFGSVTMPVIVQPANEISELYGNKTYSYRKPYPSRPLAPYADDIHYQAFIGNASMNFIEYAYGPGGAVFTYVIFAPKVVQYFNDDTSSYYGLKTTLYEDIAREIFIEEPGVFYCTNKEWTGRTNDEEIDFR